MHKLASLPTSRYRLAVVLGTAAVIAAFLIGANQISAREPDTAAAGASTEHIATPSSTAGYADSLLGGIPQHGAALGKPTAPVTLVEYADLQCPYCGQWARETLPVLVERYVRTGKLRIVFNGMAFVGPESERALRTALAAGEHNHLWDLVEGLYIRQGAENSGWVTDEVVREASVGVPGIDAEKLLAARWNVPVTKQLEQAAEHAKAVGVTSTPSFQIGPTAGKLERIEVTALDPGGITPAIEKALAR